jgi:hypothetical protein
MPKFKPNPAPFRMKGYSYPGTSPMTNKTGKILPVTRPSLITKHAPPAGGEKSKGTLRGITKFGYDRKKFFNPNATMKEIKGAIKGNVKKAYDYFTKK